MALQLEQPPRSYTNPLEQVALFNWLNKLRNLAKTWQDTIDTVVVDHGQLAGLSDDDHVHYLLVDGTRAMTGGLEIVSNDDPVLTLKTTDTTDPTMNFVTINTAHTLSVSLDEDAVNDVLIIEGKTGAVDTELQIISQSGKKPVFKLYNGSVWVIYQYNSDENKLELYIDGTLVQDWELPVSLTKDQLVFEGDNVTFEGDNVVY